MIGLNARAKQLEAWPCFELNLKLDALRAVGIVRYG